MTFEENLKNHERGRPMKRILGFLGAILSGVVMPMLAWAQERPYEYWGMHYMWDRGELG